MNDTPDESSLRSGSPGGPETRLDPDLLAIIVCPACHGDLSVEGEELVCGGCGLAYPVREDIPVLLVDEARRPA